MAVCRRILYCTKPLRGRFFPAFYLSFMVLLSLSQAGIDPILARVVIGLGCPNLCRIVAPLRRLLEASLSVCPLHTEEPPHDPITRSDDPRHAGAAVCSQDPESLYRCRRRPRQVLWLCTRPT